MSKSMVSTKAATYWAVAVSTAMFALSCGTRVGPEQAAESRLGGAAERAVPSSSGTVSNSSPLATETDTQATAGPAPARAGDAPGVTAASRPQIASNGHNPVSGHQAAGGTPALEPGAASWSGGVERSTTPVDQPGSEKTVHGGSATGVGAPGSPGTAVVLASVGTYSGPAGQVFLPMLQGAQVWVKHINQRGGLNGHPVELLVFDDGGDTARHQAQVQEAVERRHAIAFLQNGETITGEPSVEYINAKRVPVIGGIGGEYWAYSSPMYFPQGSSGESLMRALVASFAQQAIPKGKSKLGTIFCVEAQACDLAQRVFDEHAEASGFTYAYRGRTSLAQPDFTAECLSARNAGVDIFVVVLDASSSRRTANACARQGYKPLYGLAGQGTDDAMKSEPNLDGAISYSTVFAYFQTGTPATDEYHSALAAAGIPPSAGTAMGWASGKILQKAAANLPEPPTSASILAGLWTIKDDTLGGLTMPLTFVKDQPPAAKVCWTNTVIRDKAWASPDGFKMHCL